MTPEEVRAEISTRLEFVGASKPSHESSREDASKRAARTWTIEAIYRRLGLNG
jgi:hypothetical protein